MKTKEHMKPARVAAITLIILTIAAMFLMDLSFAAKKEGPAKKGGKLYFYKNGKIAKAKKEKVRSYKGKTYYVLKDGRIRKGWNVRGNDLYYFGGKNGAMVKSKVVSGITLLPNGKAEKSRKNSKGKKVKSLDCSIRIKCIKALKKRGVYNKGKSKQLRAAWNYLTDRKTFSYQKYYPNLSDKQWTKKYADRMLSNHKGNCYGYACTFAAFAWTIGYDPYVVAGRCPGGRDGAGDGFTRHCVVKIKGKWYDPEYWAIYRRHYLYGAGSTSYTFKDRHKPVRFKKVKGTISSSIKTIAGNLKKIDGNYYYFDEAGNSRKGVFLIDGKLYDFSEKDDYGWCTKASLIKELNAAAKAGSPYSGLIALIGETAEYNDECDEVQSRTYLHENIAVNTVIENGVVVIREILDKKSLEI